MLDEFVKKHKGKYLDYDGAFGAQCMDLYRIYVRDVLGVPQSPPVVGAKDVWDTYLKTHYTRLDNTPIAVVQKGDIVIWGKTYGPFGHIAISLGGELNKFSAFSQNDPLGKPCIIKEYNYNHVLGWIRPKFQEQPIMDKVDLGGLQTELETYGVIELSVLKSKLIAKDKALKGFELSLSALNGKIEELEKENKRILGELAVAREAIQKAEENRVELEEKVGQHEETIAVLKDSIDTQIPPQTNSLSRLFYSLYRAFEK